MTKKTKLELTWIGKDERPRLEPRILLEDPTLSHHAAARISDNDNFDNRVICGDNLLALKALEQEFAGKVKCVFIDPPYNTGSAFEHYDDGIEHSLWLTLMRDRLEILRRLLSDNGSIWMSIDDTESPYLRILADEVFGRANFVATIVWQKVYARDNRATISTSQDYIHVYAKNAAIWKQTRNLVPRDESQLRAYRNPDNDARGPWKAENATASAGHGTASQFYEILLPSGERVAPPRGCCWRYTQPRYEQLVSENRVWFGANGRGRPAIKRFLSEVQDGVVPTTWWPYDEVGHNQDAKREILTLFPGMEPFATPKPEALLRRVLEISTNRGDLVLDSFAGSGTTGAVAQKMGRRWIMIELGEHAHTHIVPRLRKVVDGHDMGGVSESQEWKGGGGFRYFRLAPSLLEKDGYGNWIVSREYNPAMLAAAVCKHEGFAYAPSDAVYWQQGQSTERDFIYVTTQTLSREQLAQLSEEVGPDRSLLICCAAYRATDDEFANLTIKKIPHTVLHRCEWGRDDYSLAVSQLPGPIVADVGDDAGRETARAATKKRGRKVAAQEPELFEGAEP
jgi:adenine-specific DNA-methyltransferase